MQVTTPPTTPPTGPPPGWHPDPFGVAPYRWWDGAAWSPWVWGHPGAGGPAWPGGGADDDRWFPDIRTLRFPAAWLAIALAVVLLVGNLVAGSAGDDPSIGIAIFALALFGVSVLGFPLVGVLASKRWGSGRVERDLGFRFRWIDFPLGLGGAVAMFLVVLVSGVILYALGVPQTSNLDQYGDDPSTALIVFLVVLAGVIAPLTEEVLFRGVMLRGLADRLPMIAAVGVQAAIFGSAHILFDGGWGNLGLVVPLALVGGVLGFMARWTGRLGAPILAHCFFNLGQLALFVAVGTS